MKKVAILGATGYIGRSLVPEFLSSKESYELFLFSRTATGLKKTIKPSLHERVHLDVLKSFPKYSYDIIINCTGIGEPATLVNKPAEIFKVTEQMDQLILGYLEKKPDTLYINISSGAAYGDVFSLPAKESTQAIFNLNQFEVSEYYAIAKLNSEAKHRALSSFSIIDIRVFSFFSRLMDSRSTFLMSQITRSILNTEVFETSDENIVRDYVCPKDLFSLISLLIKKGKCNDVFDVYSRREVSKMDLLEYLKKKFGLRYKIVRSSKRKKSPKLQYVSKNRKAAKLGYKPEFSSLSGIETELKFILNSDKSI